MKPRFASFALLLALCSMVLMGPLHASAATSATNTKTVPVVGTVAGGGAFDGTFTITKFAAKGNTLTATGKLTGTITDAVGNTVGQVSQQITLPVVIGDSSCTILELTLGPLDLNLLGLMVHLDQVHLEITAQGGSGNLLGNLLCSIAHLLDTNASLSAIANLLNQILALLP